VRDYFTRPQRRERESGEIGESENSQVSADPFSGYANRISGRHGRMVGSVKFASDAGQRYQADVAMALRPPSRAFKGKPRLEDTSFLEPELKMQSI